MDADNPVLHYDTLAARVEEEDDDIIPIHTYEELPHYTQTDVDMNAPPVADINENSGLGTGVDSSDGAVPGSEAATGADNTWKRSDVGKGAELAAHKHRSLVRPFTFEDGTMMRDYPISMDPEIHSDNDEVPEGGHPLTIYSSQFLSNTVENKDGESSSQKGESNSLMELAIEPELSVPNVPVEDTDHPLHLVGKEYHEYYILEPPPHLIAQFQAFQRDYGLRRSLNIKSASSIKPKKNNTLHTSSSVGQLAHRATPDIAGRSIAAPANVAPRPPPVQQNPIPTNAANMDNLYDTIEPLKVHSSDGENDGNRNSCLFDDPNYMTGLMSRGQTDIMVSDGSGNTTLDGSGDMISDSDTVSDGNDNTVKSDDYSDEGAESDNIQQDQEPARLGATPKELRSSIDPLALLDLQNEELTELDPNVVAFLMSKEKVEDETQVKVTDI